MGLMLLKIFTAAFVVLGLAAGEPLSQWRPLDPANTLVIETTKGTVVVEMVPRLAPLAVERIKLLAREGVYDGLQFHRVIDNFVDQTGNPNNRDGGTSAHPNLLPEFTFRISPEDFTAARQSSDGQAGFVGPIPVETVSAADARRSPDHKLRAWGAYCAGVVGMGRQAEPGTANSEIFLMRDAARRLDHDYTVWGKVVVGLDVVAAITVGEPPAKPDKMLWVRVASDIPAWRGLEVVNERGTTFQSLVARARREKGADFTVCDVIPPSGREHLAAVNDNRPSR